MENCQWCSELGSYNQLAKAECAQLFPTPSLITPLQ